ncbi:hypothetical protein FJZ48_04130 [Candidatus Uhrbacteria bacterium]|nr:hypothetical protein [Candidatus Uhrbacteria bacterium]
MKKEFWWWMLGILALEVLSLFFMSSKDTGFFISMILSVVLFFVTVHRPVLGLGILGVEYLIGSFGHLLPALRFWFFIAFILGWFVWAIKNTTWKNWNGYLSGRKKYFVLAVLCIYTFLMGWFRQNGEFLFVDANAWMVWFLLLPIIDIAAHHSKYVNRLMAPVLAGLVWLGMKTAVTFYLFSHQLSHLHGWFYVWIRDTRIGEITKITDHAYRIFFQSHIYFIVALLFVLSYFLLHRSSIRTNKGLVWFGSLLGATTFISLSRSLWLGLGAAILLLVAWSRRLVPVILVGVGSFIIVFALTILPPESDPRAMIDMVHARSSSAEPAALSRWQLLPILWEKIKERPIVGSGFGATVSYKSFDPRFASTGGQVTTYAFEWGWMDLWIKFGIAGIVTMLWLLISLGYRLWRSTHPEWIRVAGIASIAAFIVIHMFTPYLNHPLGIFALILGEGLIMSSKNERN